MAKHNNAKPKDSSLDKEANRKSRTMERVTPEADMPKRVARPHGGPSVGEVTEVSWVYVTSNFGTLNFALFWVSLFARSGTAQVTWRSANHG
jgi:hypothetical protein